MLVVIALGLDVGYFIIKKKMDDTYIETVLHMNQLSQADNSDDIENPFVFEFNYFANEDDSGASLFEVKLTAYTGINMNRTYSYGFQIVNPDTFTLKTYTYDTVDLALSWYTGTYKTYSVIAGAEGTESILDKYKDKPQFVINDDSEFYYFNTYDNVSYSATTALNTNNIPYVIDIAGEPYAFTFNKVNLVSESTNPFGWKYETYYASNFAYFVYQMYNSITGITDGDGVYTNLVLRLTDVFEFYEYNEATGKFDKLSDIGFNSNYMGVKVNYHTRGAKVHEDSMFNQLGNYSKGVQYA